MPTALAAWAQSTGGTLSVLDPRTDTTPRGRIERTDDRSGRDVQSGGRERAHAGGAGDLYTGHRGDLRFAGHDRPCRLLTVWRARARRHSPSPDITSRRRARASRRRTIPAITRRTRARPRSSRCWPPVISGTVAGQSTPSGQPDTPFSKAKITDPNIRTSDSLSIQITGGGGKLSDGAGFSGLTESAAGVYLLSGTAAAITKELKALVFTPNNFSATTTFTLTDTTSRGTSASDANTTVTVTNGEPVYSVSTFLANQATLDQIPGGFDILDSAANITANLDQLNDDSHIDTIAISDNGNVGASIQQLTTDTTAIGKLQNANLSPVLLAINDTTADIQAGLSTLVQDAGEIASITVSDDPIVFSAATFLADQSALDKIVGGFDVSDTAANVMADLDQLDDPNISAITISDNGQISASVAQLTTDATAIGKLQNANASPALLAINDTAGAVQTGLSTLVRDTGEIGSITSRPMTRSSFRRPHSRPISRRSTRSRGGSTSRMTRPIWRRPSRPSTPIPVWTPSRLTAATRR